MDQITKVNYYIKPLNNDQLNAKNLFATLVSKINTYTGVGANLEQDSTVARIIYEGRGESSVLKVDETNNWVILECEIADPISIDMLKNTVDYEQAIIFSPNLNCKLPYSHSIRDCLVNTHPIQEKVRQFLAKINFTLKFWIDSTYIYYAEDSTDKSIHIFNDNLLYYFIEHDHIERNRELNYKVADNITDFVAKFDEGLLPTDFYKYYEKEFKIIDYSGFNLNNVGRKVFVKPYIYEFNSTNKSFIQIAHDGSPLLYMDKILKGETLHDTIMRILSKELKIANDYIGAVVNKIVEFDVDRNNILTPRLVMRIYIKEAQMTEEQKQKKDRSWVSLNQVGK